MPEASAKIYLRLEDHATPKLKKVGQKLTGIGKQMSLFVTGPLAAIGTLAVKNASDFEEMQSKFNVVFGNLATDTQAWADEFADSVNRSTADVMEWMAALQDTFVPLGFARDEGQKMSKQLAQLTVDMASFNNAAEPDVLRDLQSALVGNHETVRKYGVIITQARLEQELMNMGIADSIKEATEQEKVLARMSIIMQGTTDAQGDAARTAESFANRLRGLKAQFQEVLIQIGQHLLPVVSELIGVIGKAAEWFGNLTERQQKIILVIAGVVAAIGPLLLIVGQATTAISAMIPVFASLNAVMAANPIGLVVIAVAALAAGAFLLIKNWDKVKAFFVNLWEKLKELWDNLPGWVRLFMPFVTIPLTIIKNWSKIKEFFIGIGDAVEEFVNRFLGLTERIRESVDKVTGFFKNMFDKVVGNSYVPDMVDRIDEEFGRLTDVLQENGQTALVSVQGIFGMMADYFENSWEPSVVSTMESVWTTADNVAQGIKDTVKNLVADVLAAFGREQAALAAALAFFMPFRALKHAAAAAAFFAAAGAFRSLAQGGDFTTNGPQLLMVGDNPSGRERVRVEPESSGEGFFGPMGGDVYFDGTKVGKWIAREVRNKNIPIYRGALSGV